MLVDFEVSYLICTYNRLDFLKITLNKLIQGLKENEEIIVVDGGSSDGSKVYLQELFLANKIHQYISEPDKNQAHGWNKAMLMARGTVIKKIIDDDVFDFSSIRKCATYMIDHPEVDVIISNDLSSKLTNSTEISSNTRLGQYKKWASKEIPSFTFGDVHMLIRKKSLALIGLYNTGYVMIDWEYALRITYLKANVVYYTGYNALSVYQEQSVSGQKKIKEVEEQSKKAIAFYEYEGDMADVSLWSKIKIAIGKILFKPTKNTFEVKEIGNLNEIYDQLYKEIELINSKTNFTFITPQNYNETKD